MPRTMPALVAMVLCAMLIVVALLPGTVATASLQMTPAIRLAIARAKYPDLRAIPGAPVVHPTLAISGAPVVHPALAGTGGPVASSAATAAFQHHMAHELALAGAKSGAYVYDMSTGKPLFAEGATVRRPPASVEKLYTSVTALERMGPQARLETSVLGVGHLTPGGVWEGDLYLHGGGDPTFGSGAFIRSHYGGVGTSVEALAAQVKQAGVRRVTGKVYGDESYFNSLRGDPSSGYAWDPYLEGVLSALAFNRGESGNEKGPHAPAAWAARRLRAALRAEGVTVEGGGGTATAPPGAVHVASVQSPTITQLLGLMLPPSDNFFAETLIKGLGARFGGAGTTAAGAKVVRETIAELGLHPELVDGSGLSETDRTSPYEVVTLLNEMARTELGTILRGDLAVAGHTGTLSERMRDSAADGRCEAKTGTLTGVSNLAGYCTAANGNVLAFAFFNDTIPTPTAHTLQDNMAITLANY
ncbi:MAG TPA: D-alanyl-D-alanine carboxypeptidase/D-alanyl-D-alanine-endopeptidase [Solirubrobacteraceae bacterium]|jgi:D-alanyl-D-alanine carboxypeptidase/D-alanyl-D-alanine-endopeptidase (penicillin-binding protein 4)|nr:D-alanyl-D-alanine carboxypeptidase/D-alanyl-D-alanine-endopeptidase [Solirubrobacteraceae bacterium]